MIEVLLVIVRNRNPFNLSVTYLCASYMNVPASNWSSVKFCFVASEVGLMELFKFVRCDSGVPNGDTPLRSDKVRPEVSPKWLPKMISVQSWNPGISGSSCRRLTSSSREAGFFKSRNINPLYYKVN